MPEAKIERIGDPRLLVVCGMPRSGTRHFVNVLNVHPGVRLAGEVPIPVMKGLFQIATLVDETYEKSQIYSGNWRRKRNRFLLESIFCLSKSAGLPDVSSCIYAGTKTPNHEFLFDDYEEFFAKSEKKPVYVYCARNPESCWASYRSMPWAQQGLKAFMKRYRRSFEKFESMKEVAPTRCIMANLESFTASASPEIYLLDHLFTPLSLELDAEQLKKIGRLRNTNSTLAKTGSPPVQLPASDLAWIRKNRKIREIVDRYFPPL